MLIFPVSMSSKFWVPATSVLVEESETIFNGIRRHYYGNYLQWDQERLLWQSSGLYIAIIVEVTLVKTTQWPITYLYDSVWQWLKKAFYFIIKKILMENECKAPYGCLVLIFYQNYFMIKWIWGFFMFIWWYFPWTLLTLQCLLSI